jgi:hypothetical protein
MRRRARARSSALVSGTQPSGSTCRPPASPSAIPALPPAAANDTFDARPVPTLPPTRLPLDFTPERVPILLTDTSAKPEDGRALDTVVRESDAVVICFDPKKPATLENVRTTWYPRVQALNPDIPIVLACCKADRLAERDSPAIREVRLYIALACLPCMGFAQT